MKSIKVISNHNGGIYVIDLDKFEKETKDWTLFEEEEVIKEEEEISYKDLKALLISKGVEFKGNSSKEQLMNLLNES